MRTSPIYIIKEILFTWLKDCKEEAMLWFLNGLIASMTGLSLVWEHGGI